MPNRGEYDGFGRTVANVKPNQDGRLFASFDFRCASKDAGGNGSWRYYLGHGPGNSAAVELFFNGNEFFRRSARCTRSGLPTGRRRVVSGPTDARSEGQDLHWSVRIACQEDRILRPVGDRLGWHHRLHVHRQLRPYRWRAAVARRRQLCDLRHRVARDGCGTSRGHEDCSRIAASQSRGTAPTTRVTSVERGVVEART